MRRSSRSPLVLLRFFTSFATSRQRTSGDCSSAFVCVNQPRVGCIVRTNLSNWDTAVHLHLEESNQLFHTCLPDHLRIQKTTIDVVDMGLFATLTFVQRLTIDLDRYHGFFVNCSQCFHVIIVGISSIFLNVCVLQIFCRRLWLSSAELLDTVIGTEPLAAAVGAELLAAPLGSCESTSPLLGFSVDSTRLVNQL